MTEQDIVQAISINLLRISEWYYKDPKRNTAICKQYLDQSKQLARKVASPKAKQYVDQLQELSLGGEQDEHTAERFLTLGVLMQHPHKWM